MVQQNGLGWDDGMYHPCFSGSFFSFQPSTCHGKSHPWKQVIANITEFSLKLCFWQTTQTRWLAHSVVSVLAVWGFAPQILFCFPPPPGLCTSLKGPFYSSWGTRLCADFFPLCWAHVSFLGLRRWTCLFRWYTEVSVQVLLLPSIASRSAMS